MNALQPLITRSLGQAYKLSIVVALLAAVSSLAGLLFQAAFYPSEALQLSFVPNDVINLCIGLPFLLISIWLTRRGRLLGLLFWPGALFYITYNYIAYAVAMPLTWQFLLYLILVLLSVYVMWRLFTSLNFSMLQHRLARKVPERLGGGVLAVFGLVFFLWRIVLVAQVLSGDSALPVTELAVVVADLAIAPVWLIGGVQLWRRRGFGYAIGPGLLFHASMLFIGLLGFFVLQPILTTTPFPLVDFVVTLGMGLIFFVPFGLFVRGIVAKSQP